MQYLRQCLRRFAARATEVMAGRYLLQQGSDVGLLDYLQVLVRRIALQPDDRLRRVENGYAFFLAERDDLFAVEHFLSSLCTSYIVPLYFKKCLVAKENLSHDPPHVVLRVWVQEVHTPPFFGRRKTAKHQQLCVRRQKWPQRVTFYFGCGRHQFSFLQLYSVFIRSMVV